MPVIQEIVASLNVRDDDEGLFSRDINGQLVRLDAPTEADYTKTVTLQIDGQEVTVPLAEPLTDANGNIVVDLEGRTTPRYTTIYDAAHEALRQAARRRGEDPDPDPLPSAAHDAGGGLPALRGADLRPEARQARGRAEAAARLPAPGEGRDGGLHHERRRARRRRACGRR